MLAGIDRMALMKPSAIVAGSAEHRLLVLIQLGQVSPAITHDKLRRSTASMHLQLSDAKKAVPGAEAVKWEWFGAGHHVAEPAPATEELRTRWALYQACDLMRLAYENILDLALDMLQEAELRRVPIGELAAELVGHFDVPDGMIWQGYSASLLDGLEPAMTARPAYERIGEARASGDRSQRMHNVVALVAEPTEQAETFGELLDKALKAPERLPAAANGSRIPAGTGAGECANCS